MEESDDAKHCMQYYTLCVFVITHTGFISSRNDAFEHHSRCLKVLSIKSISIQISESYELVYEARVPRTSYQRRLYSHMQNIQIFIYGINIYVQCLSSCTSISSLHAPVLYILLVVII